MIGNIDAVRTSTDIKATYRRYLQSLLAVRDSKLDAALREAIETTPLLDKGPYLEATPPYAPGSTVHELIEDGLLSPSFGALSSAALPPDRPLYVHQEQAMRKVAAGRNVVVATGTGSGKTESFLLPILDSLVHEKEAGTLGPGVRALLLYPMNALANDQLKRLRQLLAGYPDVTFGRYTGDTENDPATARDMFSQLNIGEPILPNELLSREEMRATPPQLLLTNYAMLEYLLLRPQDMALFPKGQKTWRFIVVDEAHAYDGTQGAEIAMLLRRVRDRVAPDRPIQCIATSATVGADADPAAVMRFASNLFGQPFEWVDADTSRQDLVTAERVDTPPGPHWGPLTAAEYVEVASAVDREQAVLAKAEEAGFSAGTAYEALLHEAALVEVRKTLSARPAPFDRVAAIVFTGQEEARAGLAALIDLGSSIHCGDGSTPISARYHLFLRATEGAFACLSDSGPHVQLARHASCPECEAPMFEIGSCTRCGAVHVVGKVVSSGGVTKLLPRAATKSNQWLVLTDHNAQVDEDEQAAADDGAEVSADDAKLCTSCGAIASSSANSCPACDSTHLRGVRKLKQRGEEIAGCLVCGARGPATVRVFETGADASGAVIATSLYQSVPPSPQIAEQQLPGEGRKLLAFSDSRQAAAYFAPYLEDSYERLKRRRLISQGLVDAGAANDAVMIEDLVFSTRKAAEQVKTFPRRMTAQQQGRAVGPWVMAEVVATDDRQSLEGLGLLSIVMDRDPSWAAPAPLVALGLSEDDAWAFLQELVRTLRQQGAVTMPADVDAKDEIFTPRLGPIYARESGPQAIRKVLSWLPGAGTNRRIDYVRRVLLALGRDDDPSALLKGIWSFLTAPATPVDWLRASTQQGLGVVYQIDHELLRLLWATDNRPVHHCTVCRRVTAFSVRGVCPALGCEGQLEEFVPPPVNAERNHYRALYRSMLAVPLKAQEHTAQWTNVEAAHVQHQFIRGEVNTLSCSTTFELGVDVGELQAVLLRNMPPTTANYVQRAGRAGRRSGAAALVVTYASRRSHDLSRFAEPEVMMSGAVRAPYVPLENARVDRRHAHSVVMAAFFRWYLEEHQHIARTAGQFFLPGDSSEDPPVSLLKAFLDPVPSEIADALARVVPKPVAGELGLATNDWVPVLLALLESVRTELSGDVAALEALQLEAAAAKNYKLAERYRMVGRTLQTRDLLGFLATRNVLPKYGFPVDSVELRTAYSGNQAGAKLDLSRDLSQAIHEYAPDATLVAGGMLWTARGIYRMPGRDLEEFEYRICKRCLGFWQALADLDPLCPHCGEASADAARTITVPEFGFVAARNPARPGPRPPRRSWSGSTYVLKEPDEVKARKVSVKHGTCDVWVGPRGRLVAVADGPGSSGFWICTWCGYGSARALHPRKPPAHDHLLTGKPCTGQSRWLDLAHNYETDLLFIDIRLPAASQTQANWKSLLYAVLEAACDELQIARDDIGGSLAPTGASTWSIVLFDTVPGGAGHVLLVEEHLERVLKAALKRVASCECGPETSCYGCLRSYGNQRDHDVLSRGAALALLEMMLGTTDLRPSTARSGTASVTPGDSAP
ncbi:DEAD/DEAH box helicase [Kribbella sp. NPDC050470]|uniref:DEAD/DEAH box helicase n=1 Tax=unclassified Kribbella TaxID=2644121 RepID=UPI0037A96A2E